MPTAFVAGATGFTGREVVRLLAEGGHRAVAHVRPDSPRLDEWRARFGEIGAEVDATPWETRAMTATIARIAPAAVFALLGTTRARAKRDTGAAGRTVDYETVDYGLTALLVAAAAASGANPRFVYLSAAGTPDGERPPATAYGRARWKAERALRGSGLPFVIARPSFIAGPGRDDDRPSESLGVRLVDASLAVAGLMGARRLGERYRSTTNTVLAAALVRLAFEPDAAGRVAESEGLR